ncbi:uncharacterized protein [Nicotiana sylvestris]|uniref:uncharacterized protein n=1 Tax=Nicotiana sylvestris TaxID=4096 RepID=UPI00388C71DB
MIKVPPNKLNATSSPWPFATWGMDVIGPIEPIASNGHRFILVAIDYFTKWIEAAFYNAATKKVVADFVEDRIVCQFGVPESIVTDNASILNGDLMKAMVLIGGALILAEMDRETSQNQSIQMQSRDIMLRLFTFPHLM